LGKLDPLTTGCDPMPSFVSIDLDDDIRQILEAEARSRGVELSTLLGELLTDAAKRIKRARIREQSEAVGRYVASHPEAKEFYEFWGRPDWDFLGEPPKLCPRRDE
jgi:hypothetical protein